METIFILIVAVVLGTVALYIASYVLGVAAVLALVWVAAKFVLWLCTLSPIFAVLAVIAVILLIKPTYYVIIGMLSDLKSK